MNPSEFILKLIPYVIGGIVVGLFTALGIKLNQVRKAKFKEEIRLGETEIDAHTNSLTDDLLVAELNKLESAERSDPDKKK